MHWRIFFIGLFVLWTTHTHAQKTVMLSKTQKAYPLGNQIAILAYTGKAKTLEQILQTKEQQHFHLSQQESPNHGFSSASYWFKARLVGKTSEIAGKEWLLQMKNPNIDSLYVYFLNEKNEILQQYTTGDRLPFLQRPIIYYRFTFPIPFEKSENITVYIHARGFYAKGHDLQLIEETQLFQESQYGLGFAIFLNTILVALVIYNLLLYIVLRDISYFYYIAYLSATATHLIATTGLGYQFVYPYWVTLANYIANAAAVLGGSFTLLFSYHFLKTYELLPVWINRVLFGLVGVGLFLFAWILFAVFAPWHLPLIMTGLALQLLSSLLLVIVLGVWTLRRGSRPAVFFLVAWGMMFLGTSLSTLRALGIEMSSLFSDFGVQIGSSLEALLLSFGLADRIKIMEREKRQAQQATIRALQENEQMIREQNQILEQKVKERTLALAEANDELSTFNEELNQTNEELQTTIEVVNQQKLDIEDKNQAIMDSIQYAKRIQAAILPTTEDFQRLLPDYFVFFRPRDVVSGDFYFLEEKNNKIILAVVDCTGHGVPGAFMSMIGKEILVQIILDNGITEADKILNGLHKGIRKALKQHESNNHDGMDLSLIVIDKAGRQAQYAGAKNSLLYAQNGEIHKIKANSMPIGGEQRESERVFTAHTISLLNDSPTLFYLFSDGFQDQFGGADNKKFSSVQFKQLLADMHQQDMFDQRQHLTKAFKSWRGTQKQIDDVLVIGVRL